MRCRFLTLAAACAILTCAMATSPAAAQSAPAGGGTVILDTAGFWRMHHVLKAPVALVDGKLKRIPAHESNTRLTGQEGDLNFWYATMLAPQTAPAPEGWAQPDFDDSHWVRGTAGGLCRTPFLERLCLRGSFAVTDPAKVDGLQLALDYHGGAVVYVNGQEVARQHLAADAALADAYPPEAFVGPDGKVIGVRGDEPLWPKTLAPEVVERLKSRVRKLTVPIPAKALRPGVNVLAVELVRAPYDKAVDEQPVNFDNHGFHRAFDLSWNTCEVNRVQLTAAKADGLVSSAVRPDAVQVWNSDPLAVDFDLDFGNPAEKLRPIELVAARNGVASGKVVVGSSKPLRGLTASVSDLKAAAGTIPAAQVRIRYGMPWGTTPLIDPTSNDCLPYPAQPTPLLALFDAPPAEIPVYKKDITAQCLKLAGGPEPVFGAVVSVWVTVKVPADAKPGTYAGTVTVSAEGLKATAVPVNVAVQDYQLSNPDQRKTWIEMIQSPDSLSMEYGIPLWSDKHWEMMAKSFTYLQEVGSKVVYIPLIAQSNQGNAESMVRWVAKGKDANGEDRYEYDFSIMDKYLDLAEKHIGKPQIVVFNAWDLYMGAKGGFRPNYHNQGTAAPLVTVVDAAGKAQNVRMPNLTDPPSLGLWKPLFDQLRERMKKRGLEGAMNLGMVSDFCAGREDVAFLKEASGGLTWIGAGHSTWKTLYDGLAGFGYQSSFFGARFGIQKSLLGWKSKDLIALFERVYLDNHSIAAWRFIAERGITGNMRGVGRLGADSWPVVRDKTGRRNARAYERFPGANWGYLNPNCAALAPGADGPVATMNFEALREGGQECEAVIELEDATTDKAKRDRLGEPLAKRCDDVLTARRTAYWRSVALYHSGPKYDFEASSWRERGTATGYVWFLGSQWQTRSQELYTLAGEVVRKLAER
jgi:hypothetical protein